MSQRLETWTIAQKWMTMDENVKKGDKGEECEKDKEKLREKNSRNTF